MTTTDLSAAEIETPPASEPAYQLSQRIYDCATNSPDTFKAIGQQLSADSQGGTTNGVKLDYDNNGQISSITLDNVNLYNSADATIPGKMAGAQLGAEVQSGDLAGALKDGLVITDTFGLPDSNAVEAGIIKGFGQNLSDKLQATDLTDARQYLANLQTNSADDAKDFLTVLQAAKDQSGLGDRLVVEADSSSTTATSFKLDGQDLLKPVAAATDNTQGPLPAAADANDPPVNLFDASRNEIPAGPGNPNAAPDKTATVAPDSSANVAPDSSANVAPDSSANVAPDSSANTNPGAGGVPDLAPPADLPPVTDNQVTTNPPAGTDKQAPTNPPPAAEAPITSDTPSGPILAPGQKPGADATAFAQPTEQDKAARDHYQAAMAQIVQFTNESLPVKRGEGYFQVVTRMHGNWSDEDIMEETHRLKAINNFSDELKVGQRLSLITDEDKAEMVKAKMAAYDQATPEQRAQMLAQAEDHARSCEKAEQ